MFATDEDKFRQLIIWLEDEKIRHRAIENRAGLHNIESPDWPTEFQQAPNPSCSHGTRWKRTSLETKEHYTHRAWLPRFEGRPGLHALTSKMLM
ncbi:C14orf166 [Cordylochernes scorpioides]|uniref:C14orf166 n=1 Tax=Cordylochernes scorpioides TaxID=51811 RepID=A0ABY6L038_9ARAC|nr:C14orf166 [Cordylochernes scorpioides]